MYGDGEGAPCSAHGNKWFDDYSGIKGRVATEHSSSARASPPGNRSRAQPAICTTLKAALSSAATGRTESLTDEGIKKRCLKRREVLTPAAPNTLTPEVTLRTEAGQSQEVRRLQNELDKDTGPGQGTHQTAWLCEVRVRFRLHTSTQLKRTIFGHVYSITIKKQQQKNKQWAQFY